MYQKKSLDKPTSPKSKDIGLDESNENVDFEGALEFIFILAKGFFGAADGLAAGGTLVLSILRGTAATLKLSSALLQAIAPSFFCLLFGDGFKFRLWRSLHSDLH